MNRKDILKELKVILQNTLNKKEIGDIKETANLFTDLGLDSVSILRMVISIEELLKVDFDDNSFRNIKTVKDVVDYIEEYYKKAK